MWLIGMMGSGKTTIGERAATHLGVPFYDTDRMVIAAAGKPIADIWETAGEEGFRALERAAVAGVPGHESIASAGGGAVLDPSNRAHMTAGAPIVWLDADAGTLATRLGDDATRPLIAADRAPSVTLERISRERRSVYRDLATHRLLTDDRAIDDLVAEVVAIWRS